MSPPARIGRYRISRRLGSGAFASVHAVVDEVLESELAMKILDQAWSADVEIRERFIQEARLLRRVQSRDLVDVFDIGQTDDGRAWFVMTLADRGTLAERLEHRGGPGRLTAADIRTVGETLAHGLTALHDADIVHRDITPRNLLITSGEPPRPGLALLDADERIMIADLGLAKDLTESSDVLTLIGGTPRYQAPEQTAVLTHVDHRADVYSATAVLWELVSGTLPPAPFQRRSRLTELAEPWRAFISQGTDPDLNLRHPDISSSAAELNKLTDRNVRPLAPAPRTVVENPYPGLAAYGPSRAAFYSGRDTTIETLLQALTTRRAVLVGGASGVGKSSLLRAGLAPLVEDRAVDPEAEWAFLIMTPGDDPLSRLLEGIGSFLGGELTPDDLRTDAGALARALDESPGPSIVLAVDQMEELLTQDCRPDDRQHFVDVLAEAAAIGTSTRVVVAARSDFYGRLSRYRWLADLMADHVFIGPMVPAELRRAIERPALRAGFSVEQELVDTVLGEATGEPGVLPHISHALAIVWERRRDGKLTLEAYRELGGIEGALAWSADQFVETLDQIEVLRLRSVLLSMVSPGRDGQPDTRGSIELSSRTPQDRDLVDRLVAERLATIDGTRAQLAHEAMLTSWPTLATWIAEARSEIVIAAELRRATGEWIIGDRNPDLLQRGDKLVRTEEWIGLADPFLTEDEQAFVVASRNRRRRAGRIRNSVIAVLMIFLLVASVAAVYARRQAERAELATSEATSRRLAAESVNALGTGDRELAGLLATIGVDLSPTLEARRAQFQAVVADIDEAQVLAAGSDLRALDVARDGTLAAGDVRGQVGLWRQGEEIRFIEAHDSEIRDLAFDPQSTSKLVTVGLDGTAALLDVASGDVVNRVRPGTDNDRARSGGSSGGDGQGRGREQDQTAGGQGQRQGDGQGGNGDARGRAGGTGGAGGGGGGGNAEGTVQLRAVALSPDGRIAALGGTGGIWLWDLENDEPDLSRMDQRDDEIMDIEWSPDGRYLAVADRSGHVDVLTIDGQVVESQSPTFQDAAFGVAWSPDGRHVYSVGRDRSLRRWVIESGEVKTQRGAHDGEIYDVTFDERTDSVITVSADGSVKLWNDDLTAELQALTGHRGDVRASVVVPDGRPATAGLDGTVRIWSNGRSGEVLELDGPDDAVLDVDANPDQSIVVAGDRNGVVTWWTVDTSRSTVGHSLHDGSVNGVALISDDEVISGGADGKLIRSRRGGSNEEIVALDATIRSVALDPDTSAVLVGDSEGVLRVIDLDSGRSTTVHRQESDVFAVRWSPDGRSAVSGDRNGNLWLHRLGTDGAWSSESVAELGDEIRSVAFDPSGRHLLAGSDDGHIRAYRTEDRELIFDIEGHGGGLRDVAWSEEGDWFVSVARDRTARIWTPTGAEIASAVVHDADIRAVHTGDGTTLITAANDGKVLRFPGPNDLRAAVCRLADRQLTADEWLRFVGPESVATDVC